MKFHLQKVKGFLLFIIMIGLWFAVWFGTDLLHCYY